MHGLWGPSDLEVICGGGGATLRRFEKTDPAPAICQSLGFCINHSKQWPIHLLCYSTLSAYVRQPLLLALKVGTWVLPLPQRSTGSGRMGTSDKVKVSKSWSQVWWLTAAIPALGRQRQMDLIVWGQPCLQIEFQDSHDYTKTPCLEDQNNSNNNKKNQFSLDILNLFM